jgi:hypothetical protein
MSGNPSNMANFTENSYNLTEGKNSWCVKPGSIYTNPNANFKYFNSKCNDPYTSYSYWYRRFPNQTQYLNCYNLPWVDPFLHNKWGYESSSAKKKCQSKPTMHFNVVNNGFKFYDTKINPTKRNVTYI